MARAVIVSRSCRHRFFRAGLFADPAWDMLLDVFVARLSGRAICVSSLCLAARVPSTTALRWVRTLEGEGALVRRSDPDDRRRVLVEISDEAFEAVKRSLLAYSDLADTAAVPG